MQEVENQFRLVVTDAINEFKMKKFFFVKFIIILTVSLNGQTILIEPAESYLINFQYLRSNDTTKKCLVVNIISKKTINVDGVVIKPLVVLKMFTSDLNEKSFEKIEDDVIRNNSMRIEHLLDKAATILTSHQFLKVATLTQKQGNEPTMFGLTIVLKRKEELIKIKGEAFCQFFNLIEYNQHSLLQSNLTNINIKALIEKAKYQVIDKINDSIAVGPISLLHMTIFELQGRIFLEKVNGDGSFHFYRTLSLCHDCIFKSYESFDYKPEVGIVRFASKIPQRSPMGEIIELENFYHFTEKVNLKESLLHNKIPYITVN